MTILFSKALKRAIRKNDEVASNASGPSERCCGGDRYGRQVRFLLLPLLFLSLTAPAVAQMKFIVQYEDQSSKWHRFQEKHNEADAVRTAKARAKTTRKRFRVVDADGRLIDLIYP